MRLMAPMKSNCKKTVASNILERIEREIMRLREFEKGQEKRKSLLYNGTKEFGFRGMESKSFY